MTATAVDSLRGHVIAQAKEKALRARIFLPPPKLTVSEWADTNRMLTSIASAEPGRWRTDRAPYQRGIMDAFNDPSIETVSVMTSAQVGKTEVVLNVAGYYMDQDPSPILVLQPTLDMAKTFSKDRLREMLRSTTSLTYIVNDSGRREADDTILHKQFLGGHITMVGANSAAGLASRPIRVNLNDEVDRFPASAGDEGDPVSLAKRRTATFWNRRIGNFSTPTIKGASRIELLFEEGDQRRFHVPCPHCDHLQHLQWSQVDFESSSYVCEGCGSLIPETAKPAMLAKGQWIAAKPTLTHASFHLNALYSPWMTWGELVTEFKAAKKSPERLRVFVNTMLGETWELDGEGVNPASLEARREQYGAEVPAGVGILTASIDVQKDRIELQVKGYGAGQESWLIAHHRLYGDPQRPEIWERADVLLTKPYAHASGATLRISLCCVDSGDGQSVQAVYAFVRPRQRRPTCPVYATKGQSVRGKPIINRPSKSNKYGVKVVPIGTDTAKDVVFARLHVTEGGHPGYMHFPHAQPSGADDEYLAQFGAEKVFLRYLKGVPIREYRQVRERNEAIDLEVLCLAALHLLGAGVYDQLAMWVDKVAGEGAKQRAQTTPETTTESVQIPQSIIARMPRRPNGYINRWR